MTNFLKKNIRWLLHTKFDFPWKRVSYSQFGEDAVLRSLIEHTFWEQSITNPSKALQTIKKYKGIYIDIGAFAPKQFSNTYFFYKNGWRGINIDATPGSMKNFNSSRGKDINIECAVSDKEEDLIYYTWEGGGAITNTFSSDQAKEFTKIYGKEPKIVTLRTKTLTQLLDENLPQGHRIDFLSIDVEGNNLKVLRSNDWNKYYPTYIIVELDNDEKTLDEIQESLIYKFLQAQNYTMVGWTCLSIIFKRR